MFDKYRGLTFTIATILAVAFIGYRSEKNITHNIEKILTEEKKIEKEIHSVKKHEEKSHEEVLSELSPSQIEEIVRNYLEKNPQIVADALDKLQQLKMDEMKKQVQEKIDAHKSELESSSSPYIGNNEAKSTIVMFYDYNCSFCKQSNDAVQNLLSKNKDVKVILKVFPILGAESEFLARLATAIHLKEPEKFKEIHEELLTDKLFNKDDLILLFNEHGLDFAKYDEIGNTEEVENIIKRNLSLAKDLRINGVPAFIINGRYYPGYLSEDQLHEKVSNDFSSMLKTEAE